MKYRIKHQTRAFQVAAMGAMCLYAVLLCISFGVQSMVLYRVLTGALILAVALTALCLLDMLIGGSIIVKEKEVTVSHLFFRRTVSVKSIVSVITENIEIHRKFPSDHFEYRLKMTMSVIPGNPMVLTDNATAGLELFGIVFGSKDRRLDKDIPLYQAYEHIKSLTEKKGES